MNDVVVVWAVDNLKVTGKFNSFTVAFTWT